MLQILLADDHELLRRGLRSLLETQAGWRVCGEASNGRQAVALATELQPNVAIIDLSMPELDGLEATRQIRRASPATEVLMFTLHRSEELEDEVAAAGAHAYLGKGDAASLLVSAVQRLAEGVTLSDGASTCTAGGAEAKRGRRSRSAPLTTREREITRLLAAGKTNGVIATILGISVKTVETHREKILRKLGLESIVELVHYAIRKGLVEP